MKSTYSLLIILLVSLVCHAKQGQKELRIKITSEVINEGYIGNGGEWDPYDEAESWGASVSDKDWETLFKRIDFMKMKYVRCMINSPYRYYNASTGKYDKTRNIKSISKLLAYCTSHDITVIFGEYNPPKWSMKQDDKWVDMSVDYLNYLVNDLGFTCIKYFVIFNEPDGDWASPNGDYDLWKDMAYKFTNKMKTYPQLFEKVKLAGPDIVEGNRNKNSKYNAVGWVKQAALEVDSLIGVYDIHAYPGQAQVRSGEYQDELFKYKKQVPVGKKIVLGESGYKYWREPDSVLMTEYNRRVKGHPFTKGSDCNMLCYDYFYGLDMPLLCMDVMNNGYSGMAVWMIDDAMHSSGDSGKPKDIKIWGMWNILGAEVFGKPDEENIRPWYYTWSLMCRNFQAGANILKIETPNNKDVRFTSAELGGKISIAAVNFGKINYKVTINVPRPMSDCNLYIYQEKYRPVDRDGFPIPSKRGVNVKTSYTIVLKAQSFVMLSNMK
ncbi:MAG: hypothetical protein PHT07_13770 [Paludibacter sp.]|nr:hypothetical protein [Paludibacter sp.]